MLRLKIEVKGTLQGKLKNVSQCIETDDIKEEDLSKSLSTLLESLRFQGFPINKGICGLAISGLNEVKLGARYLKVYSTKGQLVDVSIYCKKV